jgi:hypothetical protein
MLIPRSANTIFSIIFLPEIFFIYVLTTEMSQIFGRKFSQNFSEKLKWGSDMGKWGFDMCK